MGSDVMEDDYEYYESQAAKQDRMNSRAKTNIEKIKKLLSAVSVQKYINDKHLDKRFRVLEQDLDDNVATPDNVVMFDKKKNAIYSVDGYSTAVGFGDPEHQRKRN
ncbi:MAG: hypothetical protein EZS28_031454 [Streblomastix strix]|uniref:Uncharacterized protein n=1 Tax=Streblomastix strix TaxID=222440 RepID=A0A5J4URL0_9EUKA|nr:MAG: hypothetical protein EZS28_031454 [Streblomastix strix]